MTPMPGGTPGATPRVSVIVPVYNDAESLAHCLAALARQTYPQALTEVLVVDNGSSQDIATVVADHLPRARLLHEAMPGSYAARNRGLAEASGQVLAFTDADCLPEPDWIAQGVAALQAEPASTSGRRGLGLVAGEVRLFPRDPTRPTGTELWEMANVLRQKEAIDRQHFGVTANLFTTRAVLQAVGPFDAALKSRGDYDWGRRVHEAGYSQAYCPAAVVLHPARRSLREFGHRTRRIRGGSVALGELRPDARRWLGSLVPPLDAAPRAREASRQYGWSRGVRFFFATYYQRVVGTLEEVRLALDGAPRR